MFLLGWCSLFLSTPRLSSSPVASFSPSCTPPFRSPLWSFSFWATVLLPVLSSHQCPREPHTQTVSKCPAHPWVSDEQEPCRMVPTTPVVGETRAGWLVQPSHHNTRFSLGEKAATSRRARFFLTRFMQPTDFTKAKETAKEKKKKSGGGRGSKKERKKRNKEQKRKTQLQSDHSSLRSKFKLLKLFLMFC